MQDFDHARSNGHRKITEEELNDPVAAQNFRNQLATIQSPLWPTPLNEHHHHVSHAISKAIHVAFPKPKSVSKKPHVD